MIGRGDRVMGVEATIKDLDRSVEIVAVIRQKLNGPYLVKDWYELNVQLFTSLYGERRP
jgi:ABC-type lipoprotein release transport system permease subunit